MPWWGWLALGAALLGAEIAVQTEFWLAVLGAAAFTLGLALTLGLEPPVWIQWLGFAALAIGYNVFFRRSLYEKFVGHAPGLAPELEGEHGTVLEPIEPGQVGPVQLRGSQWRARNVGDTRVEAQAQVLVVGRQGIIIEVRG